MNGYVFIEFLLHYLKNMQNYTIIRYVYRLTKNNKEDKMNASVVMIIASDGYQPIEYATPKKILEQAGFMVTVASDKQGTAVAADKSTTRVDLTLNNVIVDHYTAVIFIGGPGALDCLDNSTSYRIIKNAQQAKKLIAAICVAPRILAKSGILKGKRATGWDGDGELAALFKEYGVVYEAHPVVIDGLIITASGPQVAQEFGKKIVERLSR
jgi:protease I